MPRVNGSTVNATVTLCLLLPLSALAQERQAERERGGVLIGAFITDRATSARLDSGAGGSGSNIDFEDDLGLESSTSVARFGAYFWLKPRHRFDFSIFDLSRDATRQIDETIEFGDETYVINTVVTTNNDVTITKLDYTFVPLNRMRGYLGITGGLYVSANEITLSEPTLGAFESEDITAPLPVIGLRGEYKINERFMLRGAMQWFGIDTGDVDGRLVDTYVGVDYSFGRHVAVGLAYNDVSLNVSTSEGARNGMLDWGYDGILLYTKVTFGGN